ncbi:MAG: TlpA disulfide reductase family protein [Kofleriaceae bacterium]
MAGKPKKDLPVATALPSKKAAPATAPTPPRGVIIDPVVVGVGGAVAAVGILVLSMFLWMVPTAAAREAQSACRGIGGFDPADGVGNHPSPMMCPGGVPCTLPIPAPDFTALDITGKPVRLSDFRGKVVLLNFWASWCGVCKTEKPSLDGMASELANNDFVVLTLASDRSFTAPLISLMESLAPGSAIPRRDDSGEVPMAQLKESFEHALPKGLPFKVVLDVPKGDDNLGPITQSWGLHAVPESALIDRKGNIRAYFVNKRDWESSVARTCLRSVIDE